jgi:hypothetical protein
MYRLWRGLLLGLLTAAALLIFGAFGHHARLGWILFTLALGGELVGDLVGTLRRRSANRSAEPS